MTTSPTQGKNIQLKDLSDELQLIHSLHMLINSARIYKDNNELLINAVANFVAIIDRFAQEEDEITLLAASGRLYIQQEKVSYRSSLASMVNTVLLFFEKRKIKGVRFFPSAVDASIGSVASFARHLNQCLFEEDPSAWLDEKLRTEDFPWVEPVLLTDAELEDALMAEERAEVGEAKEEPETLEDEQEKDPEQERKKKAMLAYGYALNSLQEVSQKVSSDRKASVKKALRMVHIMIDTVMEDNNVLLSLSTIRDYDDYTFTHSLNVAILSMCLGNRIGLSKNLLETLSLSALFHDLGKIDVPKNILNKPGKLSGNEFKEMKNHSLYSVRQIILLKASQKKKGAIMLPPFEHHLKFDLSGYPQTPRKKPVSLFGRIITIADVFDAITAKRVYRSFPISPDRALSIMQEGAGTDFDPLLLKVFINMIGVYPIGTLLRLDNDQLGLVAKYGGDSEDDRELWIQLLTPLGKGGFVKGDLLNLGPLDHETKTFNRPVLESLHPAAYNIQPADYLL